MDERKYGFLKAVLGEDGAAALQKAAERSQPLENALVPRAILAWLGVAGRGSYEGNIPGVDDSYLDFAKSEDSFVGAIAVGDEVYPFEGASILHLAASIAVALGSDVAADPNLKDLDLARLGKSIDVLVKAKYVTDMDLQKALNPGPAHAPTEQEGPGVAQAPTKQPRAPRPKLPKTPRLPKHIPPKATVQTPKIPGLPKAFPLAPVQMKSECPECGLKLIKNERFVGCLCFRDLARHITLRKSESGMTLTFAREVDADAVATVLETLGVK